MDVVGGPSSHRIRQVASLLVGPSDMIVGCVADYTHCGEVTCGMLDWVRLTKLGLAARDIAHAVALLAHRVAVSFVNNTPNIWSLIQVLEFVQISFQRFSFFHSLDFCLNVL